MQGWHARGREAPHESHSPRGRERASPPATPLAVFDVMTEVFTAYRTTWGTGTAAERRASL